MAADTIFALSSGAPPAAIAIIRVSGPGAGRAGSAMAGSLPAPRTPALRRLIHPTTGLLLDRGLMLWFPGSASTTGEDLLELHVHGGRAVVESLLGALKEIDGLRGAEPGEFTRRAFENGRIDLAEAEGLADLLRAETEAQRRSALAIAEGGLSARVADWQTRLLHLSAAIEAELDFSDEDDIPDGNALGIQRSADGLLVEMRAQLALPDSERLREGVRVAIAGPPNAGKSTLLNALAGRDAAIVSDIAGTTRDLIEVPVALGGTAFLLSDTAGLRAETEDPIERIGIDRARGALDRADIILWLGDDPPEPDPRVIHLLARSDLPGRAAESAALAISAKTGTGIAELIDLLRRRAAALLPREGDLALSRRQKECVAACADHLAEAARTSDLLIVAEHLRQCRSALDRLTGRAGTEEMLDALFGAFCIGK